jgi:hypothetical protein
MTPKEFKDIYQNLLEMISKETMKERQKLKVSIWKKGGSWVELAQDHVHWWALALAHSAVGALVGLLSR